MADDLDSLWDSSQKPAQAAAQPSLDDLWNDAPSGKAGAKAAPATATAPTTSANASGGQDGYGKAIQYGLAQSIPFSHDIGAAIQAGETYLPKWVSAGSGDDIGQTDPNASFSDRYSQQKKRIDATSSKLDSQFPVTSLLTPAIAGGAVLPLSGPVEGISGVIGNAAPFLRGLPAATAASGAVGAGLGAAYGAGNGSSLNERLDNAKSGAELGGVFGAAGPAVGKVAGNLWNGVASKFGLSNPDSEAQAAIRLARDPNAAMSPSDVQNAQAAGQPITAADVLGGPQVQRLADKAAVGSPQAQATIKNVVDPRFEEQGARTDAFMQNLFGSNLNPSDIIDGLTSQAKVANNANYKAAFSDPAAQSVWNPSLENIVQSPSVKKAIAGANATSQEETVLERAQAQASGMAVPNDPIVKNPFVTDPNGNLTLPKDPTTGQPTVTPNLKFWDIVKRNLDSQYDSSLSNVGKPTNDSRLINGLRSALVQHLDNAVPAYQQARAGAAGFFGENDAFTAGMKYLGNKNALQSSQADAALNTLTPAQRGLFSKGVAADMVQKAQNANVRTNALRQFNTPATAGKLRNALGPYSDQVESFLRVEDRMNQLKQSLGSSLTGQRNVDQHTSAPFGHGFIGAIGQAMGPVAGGALVGGAGAYHEGINPMYGAAAGATAGIAAKRGAMQSQAVNEAIARMLMEGDPQKIARTATAISQKPSLMNALRSLGKPNLAIPLSQKVTPSNQNQLQPAGAYARGGAVKKKLSHEELVARLMNLSEQAKNATKRDTKGTLGVPDNVVAKAMSIAQKAI